MPCGILLCTLFRVKAPWMRSYISGKWDCTLTVQTSTGLTWVLSPWCLTCELQWLFCWRCSTTLLSWRPKVSVNWLASADRSLLNSHVTFTDIGFQSELLYNSSFDFRSVWLSWYRWWGGCGSKLCMLFNSDACMTFTNHLWEFLRNVL